jgi:hypothetical protein
MGHRGRNQRLEVRPQLIGGIRKGLTLSRSFLSESHGTLPPSWEDGTSETPSRGEFSDDHSKRQKIGTESCVKEIFVVLNMSNQKRATVKYLPIALEDNRT